MSTSHSIFGTSPIWGPAKTKNERVEHQIANSKLKHTSNDLRRNQTTETNQRQWTMEHQGSELPRKPSRSRMRSFSRIVLCSLIFHVCLRVCWMLYCFGLANKFKNRNELHNQHRHRPNQRACLTLQNECRGSPTTWNFEYQIQKLKHLSNDT